MKRRGRGAARDGIVATAPFYTRTHPAEIDEHFRHVAEAGRRCRLTPTTSRSRCTPSSTAELVLRLAADGVLAGLKDSSGDDAGLR